MSLNTDKNKDITVSIPSDQSQSLSHPTYPKSCRWNESQKKIFEARQQKIKEMLKQEAIKMKTKTSNAYDNTSAIKEEKQTEEYRRFQEHADYSENILNPENTFNSCNLELSNEKK